MNKKNIIITALFCLMLFFSTNTSAVTCPTTGSWDGSSGVCIPLNTGLNSPATANPIATIISNVMGWILGIFGSIAIIAFVISGIQYVTSAGNENQIETAKRQMKWSIVGVVVALSGLVILYAIENIMSAAWVI